MAFPTFSKQIRIKLMNIKTHFILASFSVNSTFTSHIKQNFSGKMFASMYYQLRGSLIKIVGFVLQFVVLTIRSCQINHQYQRDVLLADF